MLSNEVDQSKLKQLLDDGTEAKYGSDEYKAWVAEVRAALEALVGQTWTTDEMSAEFTIDSFAYCFAFGRRKSDGVKVSIDFLHSPRFYHSVYESN